MREGVKELNGTQSVREILLTDVFSEQEGNPLSLTSMLEQSCVLSVLLSVCVLVFSKAICATTSENSQWER